MKRRDDLYLVDIIEAATQIAEFLRDCNAAQFAADNLKQSAVVWKMVIIGETSSKLATEIKDQFNDIPWERIRGFRNRLVHGYFDLRWEEVRRVAVEDVPPLKSQAEQVLMTNYPEIFRKLFDRQNKNTTS